MRISDWSSDVCSSDLRSDTASVHRSPTRGESPAPLARHQSAHRPDRVRVRLLTSTAFLERFHEVQRHDAGKFSTRYRTAKLTVPELGVSRLGSVPATQSTLGIASDAALPHLVEHSCDQPQMLTQPINDTHRVFRAGGRLKPQTQ